VGYLQSLLHEKARNNPGNRGTGWLVTGNISGEFLTSLKSALDYAEKDRKGKEVLRDTIATNIIQREIFPNIRAITLSDVANADQLFDTLTDFLKVVEERPLRKDFTLELERLDRDRHVSTDTLTLWSVISNERESQEDKNAFPEQFEVVVSVQPNDNQDSRRSSKIELTKSFDVEIPAIVRSLVLEQQQKIKTHDERISNITRALTTLTNEKFNEQVVKKGGAIDAQNLLSPRQLAEMGNMPMRAVFVSSQMTKDERTFTEGWRGKYDTEPFSMDGSGSIKISSNLIRGTYDVSVTYQVDMPEPPQGSRQYAEYFSEQRNTKQRTFTIHVPVHIQN
jgi:hypothetical protein